MNLNFKKLFSLLLLLNFPLLSFIPHQRHYFGKTAINNTHPFQYGYTYNTTYEKVVKYIKLHEGFRESVYMDGVNEAIGYGTHIKYHGYIPDIITKRQADSLLRVSFNRNLEYINSHYKELNYRQKLAVTHLAYCVGIGTIINNDLINKLKDSSIIEIYNGGHKDFRRFEVILFNSN
jgi:GH24 family phage-related lysozyme (muramidase)